MLYKICALKIRRHAHVLVWCLFILTDDDADPLYKVENDKEYYDNVGKKGYLLILNSKSNRTGTAAHYTVKSALSGYSIRRPKIGFQDQLSLNAGQKNAEFSKRAFCNTFDLYYHKDFKAFVLSIFEWLLNKGFNILQTINWPFEVCLPETLTYTVKLLFIVASKFGDFKTLTY